MAKEVSYKMNGNKDFTNQRNQNGGKKCDSGKKEDCYCNHWKAPGHTRDTCFKLLTGTKNFARNIEGS